MSWIYLCQKCGKYLNLPNDGYNDKIFIAHINNRKSDDVMRLCRSCANDIMKELFGQM